eukprot:gnl/Ergobibamus_cyprinoides/174.p1 GENE.gnl/Ergobibamus_cyprinoides/174~~gnl/Ergobibamus_cyprinoides/174.p1  ORF type:complete len:324 (+),score=127.45 gnl/Ergobibamus_cyprinoides/174:224-1195(+)
MLYVDNPVGAGYSYADLKGYPRNETNVARDFAKVLKAFFEYFPEFANLPLFMTSESYGGHYAPEIASFLLNNPVPGVNLRGAAWGDGMTVPVKQSQSYAQFALGQNIISRTQAAEVELLQDQLVAAILAEDWTAAHVMEGTILETVLTMAGNPNQYDVRQYRNIGTQLDWVAQFLASDAVRDALHAGTAQYDACDPDAQLTLWRDFFNSSEPAVRHIADAGLPTIVYTGNEDLIIPGISQDEWVWDFDWQFATEWRKTKRECIFFEDPDNDFVSRPAFFWQRYANFALAHVMFAGHTVPETQGPASRLLIDYLVAMSQEAPQM